MKFLKRNAIIITVILFVCMAVYLNWAYNRQERELTDIGAAESAGALTEVSAEGSLYYAPVSAVSKPAEALLPAEITDYFTTARLNRQQARDSAISTLREAAETEHASQQAIDDALGAITAMAGYTVSEAELESMILAKGFADCLVFLNEDSILVAVPAVDGQLSASAVSRITDLVLQETALGTEQIKIIGVK